MKLIVCMDEKGGMAFNRRRQTRDVAQRQHLSKLVGENVIWMSPYSAKLYADHLEDAHLSVDNLYLERAGEEDFVLAEREQVDSFFDRVDEIHIYHWNRSYPGDVFFPQEVLQDKNNAFRLDFSEEFPGHSHDLISYERYSRCRR